MPTGGRVIAILAGSGDLPVRLREHLREGGHAVRLIAIAGEASATLDADARHSIADVEGIFRSLERLGADDVVLIGGIARRPRIRDGRVGRRAFRAVAGLIRALPKGDDEMLRAVVEAIEGRGIRVVGIHELWPELLAEEGAIFGARPSAAAMAEIEIGRRVASALGEMDVGQAVVAVGRRVVAVEGLEGTDAMLRRVGDLRREGRLRNGARSGVLVKRSKPAQELRVDMPTIGPNTVLVAAEAGLAGIAIDAGRTLVTDRAAMLEAAKRSQMFIWGMADD